MTTNDLSIGGAPPRARRGRRLAALAVAVLAGMTGGSVAAVGPAGASVPNLQAVSATLVSSTAERQSVTVQCPAGTELISAAGYITGAIGAVTMDDIFPDPTTNSVTVTGAVTDPPYASTWRPTAIAYCADHLAGLEWIEARSPYNSDDKFVTATCPSGKKLVGSGASVHNGVGEVLLTGIVPKNGGVGVPADSVTANAAEETSYASPWQVIAFAACATQLSGQEVIFGASAHDSADPKSPTPVAACTGNKVATGGGVALIISPGGIGNVVVDDLYPNNVDTGNPPTETISVGYGEDTPVGAPWTVKVFALCANP